MAPSQPTAKKKVDEVLSLIEEERLLQAYALLTTVRESLLNTGGNFPSVPVFPLHSPHVKIDEIENGGDLGR